MQRTFHYDVENRQTYANVSNAISTYSYDGNGKRVQAMTPKGTTTYVYDAMGELAAEYSTVAIQDSGTSFLTADHLGSTRVITDSSGAVKRRFDYYPFGGEILAGIGPRTPWPSGMMYNPSVGLPDIQSMKFTSKERDSETGLDFFLARYYSGAQGRFTSPDRPFADQNPFDPQSWNLYTYGRNSPVSNIDPTGRTCVTVTHPDGTSNQVDNGDTKGCEDAGVAASKSDSLTGESKAKNSDITPQDFEFVYGSGGNAYLGSAALLGQFLSGSGHDNRTYDEQTSETQSLLKSGGIQQISKVIAGQCAAGATQNPLDENGLLPQLSTPDAATNLLHDALFSPVGAQVGGYRYAWQAAGSGVSVQIHNVAGANSFYYHQPKISRQAIPDETGQSRRTFRSLFRSSAASEAMRVRLIATIILVLVLGGCTRVSNEVDIVGDYLWPTPTAKLELTVNRDHSYQERVDWTNGKVEQVNGV